MKFLLQYILFKKKAEQELAEVAVLDLDVTLPGVYTFYYCDGMVNKDVSVGFHALNDSNLVYYPFKIVCNILGTSILLSNTTLSTFLWAKTATGYY